jgi:SAM-dependent methyltransferase
MSDATDAWLASQYETYPYPERDPRQEAKRLLVGSPSHLREIDWWVFGARRPRARPLRVLVAGGGTGDGAIMLATQMQRLGQPGTILFLERAQAALAIARARAQTRGLGNIVWQQGSLLDLPGSGLGPFDYIDCCGVLHHLPDPAAGLAALLAVLAPGGGLGLMVYAPHGRTGVYMVQDALRLLAPPEQPPQVRLDIARRVMRHLPATNWLHANRNFSDHLSGGDAGLFDLLLNPRDRAYTAPALFALLAAAGLVPTALIEPLRYDPATYLPEPKLRALAAALDAPSRAALAEALCGNMSTHVVYCRRATEPLVAADPLAPTAVPVAREMPAPEIARAIRPDGTLPLVFDSLRVPLALPPLAPALLGLIDGERPLGAILATLAGRGIAPATAARAWEGCWAKLSAVNRILLAPPP